jgi:hypothetical protein
VTWHCLDCGPFEFDGDPWDPCPHCGLEIAVPIRPWPDPDAALRESILSAARVLLQDALHGDWPYAQHGRAWMGNAALSVLRAEGADLAVELGQAERRAPCRR